MPAFAWVADGHVPPWTWDLRRAGWHLQADAPGDCVQLVDMRRQAGGSPHDARNAGRLCICIGVDCGQERARLLDAGFGDALPASVELPELAQRAGRVAATHASLPRLREAGPLALDLLHRDARVGDRWLALHPREFGLLWRLAEFPGEPVSRARLLHDVWRLDFDPGTNTVEVHVSRLRSKLAAAGAARLIETSPPGYRLRCQGRPAHFPNASSAGFVPAEFPVRQDGEIDSTLPIGRRVAGLPREGRG